MSTFKPCDECGRPRLIGYEPEPGALVFCNNMCEREFKRKHPASTPKPNVGPRSTTARSRRQSQAVKALIGGQIVPGSGAITGKDGDHVTKTTMLELKTTAKRQYTLRTFDWEKLLGEAGRAGKKAAFILDLDGYKICMMPLDEALSRLDGEL